MRLTHFRTNSFGILHINSLLAQKDNIYTSMTDLQRIEFEILQAVDKVCEQLHIKYYLVCGSALGAVKYDGFIPWDDDLDIGLLRPDYEVFIREAATILPNEYFLQNYRTDPAFPQVFSKVRDSRTTFVEKSAAKLPIHHGVYIDVFPLDGYPHSSGAMRHLETWKKIYNLESACAFQLPCRRRTKIFFGVERLLGLHKRTHQIMEKYDRLISSFSVDGSSVICNHGNWQGKLEYAPQEQYGDGVWATFEGLKVRIPAQYDAYLMQKYGDWRADLPDEQKVGHHYAAVIDLNRPYTDYIEKLSNGAIKLKSPQNSNI